jgi:hypothetical protein
MSSIIVGYAYCHIAYIIPFSISESVDNTLIIVSSAIIGYILARLYRCKPLLLFILDHLKIRDTGNMYMWDDIMDNDNPMRAVIKFDNTVYDGIIHNYESYSNEPHVALAAYTIFDTNGNVIYDYSEDYSRITILNTADAVSVDFIYCNGSNECKDIEKLCDFKKRFYHLNVGKINTYQKCGYKLDSNKR